MNKFLTSAILAVSMLGSLAPAFAQTTDMDAGLASFYTEKWDDAIKNFQTVVSKDPQNSLALSYLMHSYFKKKDITSIVNQMEQQAVAKGNDPTAQAQLGMAYFLKGMVIPQVMEESLTEFKNAIKDDSKNSLAYTGMGMIYFQKRQIPKAKGFFVKALRSNPHDLMALDRLGNILMVDDKKPEEALQLYERIVAELPSYPDGQYFMGSALFDLKRYEDAVVYLQKARDLDPKGLTQGFDAATLLGDCYLKLNKAPEAIAAFEAAQKIQPNSTYVKLRLDKARNPGKKN